METSNLHRMHVTRSRHFDRRTRRDVFDRMKHEASVVIIEDIFERRDGIARVRCAKSETNETLRSIYN